MELNHCLWKFHSFFAALSYLGRNKGTFWMAYVRNFEKCIFVSFFVFMHVWTNQLIDWLIYFSFKNKEKVSSSYKLCCVKIVNYESFVSFLFCTINFVLKSYFSLYFRWPVALRMREIEKYDSKNNLFWKRTLLWRRFKQQKNCNFLKHMQNEGITK